MKANSKTVTLTLSTTVNYALGNPFAAAITIQDQPIDAWRFANFGVAANSPAAADTADPDYDAITNLMEYGFGMDPLIASTIGLPSVTIAPVKPAKPSGSIAMIRDEPR